MVRGPGLASRIAAPGAAGPGGGLLPSPTSRPREWRPDARHPAGSGVEWSASESRRYHLHADTDPLANRRVQAECSVEQIHPAAHPGRRDRSGASATVVLDIEQEEPVRLSHPDCRPPCGSVLGHFRDEVLPAAGRSAVGATALSVATSRP